MTESAGSDDDFWAYPLKWGETLSNHDWMPLHINRLLSSRFVAYACADDRRGEAFTAMLLWFEAMKQDPAGTLPVDDVELAQMARYGADVASWRLVKDRALYGWRAVHVDGFKARPEQRLGHAVVAEVVADMFRRKRGRDQGREAQKVAVQRSRVRAKLRAMKLLRQADSDHVVAAVTAWLGEHGLFITDDNVRAALEAAAGVPRVVALGRGETD